MDTLLKFRRLAVAGAALSFASIWPLSAAFADANLGCPADSTAASVTAWRLQIASGLQSGSVNESSIASQLSQCFSGTPLPSCLQRLSDYASRDDVADSGLDVAVGNSPEKTPPADFWAPGGSSGQYVLPPDIEATAAQHGWLTIRYKSRHSGGFDPETPSLLMVYVSGDKVDPPVTYDRWLNFALPADSGDDALKPAPQTTLPGPNDYAQEANGAVSLPQTFTMVSLDRKTAPGVPGQVYFQMFNRQQSGSPVFTAGGNVSPSGCYSCHPNGLRAISPLGFHVRDGEEQLDPSAWTATKMINDAMDLSAGRSVVSWRQAPDANGNFKPLLRPLVQGPVVGPMQPLNGDSRSQAFISGGTAPSGAAYNGCAQSRSTISVRDIFGRAPGANNVYTLSSTPNITWQKVSAAMNCEGCHNGRFRGSLNAETSFSEIEFKILVDQSMPQGYHQDPMDQGSATAPVHDSLTPDERIALANCLYEESKLERTHLADWLTQAVCQ